MIGMIAAKERTALVRSIRPAERSRNSGNSTGAKTSTTAITKTLTRKTEPHQKYSRRAPPTRGPRAIPAEKLLAHMPMAWVRCAESWNMFVISARVDGSRIAPARPIKARAAMSISGLFA
jgi:hypothetical protein